MLQIAKNLNSNHGMPTAKPRFGSRVKTNASSSTQATFSEQAVEISKIADRGQILSSTIDILRSLRFPDMEYRQAHIPQAYPKTYEWAHESLLSTWMGNSHPLFWITGKPGSGKSTLMKYVVENAETRKSLSRWAGSNSLLVSSHFFWTNGSPLQRSLAGLLRKVLFAVFSKYPEMMENHAIRTELAQFLEHPMLDYSVAENEWTTERLLAVFMTILRQTSSTHKFVIFIDGVDEFKGDHAMLAQEITALGSTANLKLCVASRPWNVFEAAFGSDGQKLYMHQLTQGDIRKYVHQKFEATPSAGLLGLESDHISRLAEEIIEKAQGVFLWVALVVRSLLAGFQNADKLSDLRRRLAEFPPDLDEYFKFILHSLDPFYRAQASKGFHAALSAHSPLTVNHFWYLDLEEDDPEYAISKKFPGERSQADEAARAMTIERRVNARYKGLLEVNGGKVDFLHASVKDFLSTQTCQEWLTRWTPNGFQVQESLTKAYLADLKDICRGGGWSISNLDKFYALAGNLLHSAERYAETSGSVMTAVFLELDKIMDIDSGNNREYLTAAPFYGLIRCSGYPEKFVDAVLNSPTTCNLDRKRDWCARLLRERGQDTGGSIDKSMYVSSTAVAAEETAGRSVPEIIMSV